MDFEWDETKALSNEKSMVFHSSKPLKYSVMTTD